MVISKQQVVRWKSNTVTKAALAWCNESREALKEHIITGGASGRNAEDSALSVAKSIGKAEAFEEMSQYFIEDLLEEAIGEDDED